MSRGRPCLPTSPPRGRFKAVGRGGDAFVTKLPPNGGSLAYSTFLGGSDHDYGKGIAVDGPGNAYVTGDTLSADFPTRGPVQTDQGGADAFVAKLSANGSSLVYSTYLGGSLLDYAHGIAVDDAGNAYVVGLTDSPDFPTQAPVQTDQAVTDVFVAALSSGGSTLVYSTYLGGNSDYGYGIAVGTYLDPSRAQSELSRLRSAGAAAGRVTSAPGDGVVMHTVVIGAYPSRAVAEREANVLLEHGLVEEARIVSRSVPVRP